MRLARHALMGHLGIAATQIDPSAEWIPLGFAGLRCRITLDGAPEPQNLALWYEVEVPGSPIPIRLGIAGLGETVAQQAANAGHDFHDGVVSVLRRQYAGGADERVTSVQVTSMTGDAVHGWDIRTGPPTMLGSGVAEGEVEELERLLKSSRPLQLIFNDVTAVMADVRLHWAKLFMVRILEQDPLGEVAIDNVAVPGALVSLRELPLPPRSKLIGFRQFMLITPNDRAVTEEEAEDLRSRTSSA